MGIDIKKDDTVRVMAGKDRGKEGRVVRVLPSELASWSTAWRWRRSTSARPDAGPRPGPSSSREASSTSRRSSTSRTSRSCAAPAGSPTRVGHRTDEDGVKSRFCRKCEAEIYEAETYTPRSEGPIPR